MRRPIHKLVLIVLAIFGTAAIAYAPLVCLNAFAANLFRTRALGWSDPAYRVTPREPHDVHFDRMLSILPFCPCVKEVRLVPVSGAQKDRHNRRYPAAGATGAGRAATRAPIEPGQPG
jgi:hypothetical protein